MEQNLITLVDAVVRDCYGLEGLNDDRAFDGDHLSECPARLAAHWETLRKAFGIVEVRQLAMGRLETTADCVQLLRGLLRSLSRRTNKQFAVARYPGTKRLRGGEGKGVTKSHCLWRITSVAGSATGSVAGPPAATCG